MPAVAVAIHWPLTVRGGWGGLSAPDFVARSLHWPPLPPAPLPNRKQRRRTRREGRLRNQIIRPTDAHTVVTREYRFYSSRTAESKLK